MQNIILPPGIHWKAECHKSCSSCAQGHRSCHMKSDPEGSLDHAFWPAYPTYTRPAKQEHGVVHLPESKALWNRPQAADAPVVSQPLREPPRAFSRALQVCTVPWLPCTFSKHGAPAGTPRHLFLSPLCFIRAIGSIAAIRVVHAGREMSSPAPRQPRAVQSPQANTPSGPLVNITYGGA